VERMSSLKTDDKSLYKFRRPSRDGVCGKKIERHTRRCVQSPLVVLLEKYE